MQERFEKRRQSYRGGLKQDLNRIQRRVVEVQEYLEQSGTVPFHLLHPLSSDLSILIHIAGQLDGLDEGFEITGEKE